MHDVASQLPERCTVVIEVPRGSFVKRNQHGGIDFVSPVPSPFNYGSVIGVSGDDGDPIDAVWVGPRRPVGTAAELPVRGVVRFVDAGIRDDKWICSAVNLSRRDVVQIKVFFRAYAAIKLLSGRRGTLYQGYWPIQIQTESGRVVTGQRGPDRSEYQGR